MSVETTQRPVEQLFGTDPGDDDAIALLAAAGYYALNPHPDRRISFIATYGNAQMITTSANLNWVNQFIRENLKSDSISIKSYEGADRPFHSHVYPLIPIDKHVVGGTRNIIHGDNAMEGIAQSTPRINISSEVIYSRIPPAEQAEAGNIDFFSFGAPTELALMMYKYPQLIDRIDTITMMGGAIDVMGNRGPRVEGNMAHDPAAFRRILQIANEHQKPIIFVPLDVTMEEGLEATDARIDELTDKLVVNGSLEIASLVKKLIGPESTYNQLYKQTRGYKRKNSLQERAFLGPLIHDLTALFARIHPELFDFERVRIKIEDDGDIARCAAHHLSDGEVLIPHLAHPEYTDDYWRYLYNYLSQYK